MSKSEIKKVVFDPNLSYENMSNMGYNVEKDSESITQDFDINLENFENDVNQLNQNYVQKTVNLNEIDEQTNNDNNDNDDNDDNNDNDDNDDNDNDNDDNDDNDNDNDENNQTQTQNQVDNDNDENNQTKTQNQVDNDNDENNENNQSQKYQLKLGGFIGPKLEQSKDIDLYLDEKLKNVNPLVNKNNVKKNIEKYINNFYSKKQDQYYDEILKIYQKNVKKYSFKKDNGYLVLLDKKSKKVINKIKDLNIINLDIEIPSVKKEIQRLKTDLIDKYQFIKKNIHIQSKLELDFNKIKNNYKNEIEKLITYQLYHKIINNLENNKALGEQDTTKLYLSQPDININALKPYKYNEKKIFEIPDNLIQEIYEYNTQQLKLYNKIIQSEKKDKSLILEYLENKKNKKFSTELKKNKNLKNINYILDS